MFKLLIGVLAGLFAGFPLELVFPVEFFHIACTIPVLPAVLFFFHQFRLRDFQKYYMRRSSACND